MTTHLTQRLRATALTIVALTALSACGNESDSKESDAPAKDSTSSSSTPSESSSTTDGAPAAVELTAAPQPDGTRCAVPTPELLDTVDTAFEGTVTALGDGQATLSVDNWFRGEGEPTEVTVTTPSAKLADLLMAVDFKEGQTYLVSATNGEVNVCGLSAPVDEQLSGMYQEAFKK